MGTVEQRVLHNESLCDALEDALANGTDHELTLRLVEYLRSGIMQHSVTANPATSVSLAVAQNIAANLGMGLASMIKEQLR